MNQEKLNKILLKYEVGRSAEDKRRMAELRQEIVNPAQSKIRFFENINAGLKKIRWQRTADGITTVLLIAANMLLPVSEILKAFEEVCRAKIIFYQNKLFSCLQALNLQDKNLFMRLRAVCRAVGVSCQATGVTAAVNAKGHRLSC